MISIAARVAELPTLTVEELHQRWQEVFNEDPSRRNNHSFLVDHLAYRIQEIAFGGVSQETRKRLNNRLKGVDIKKSGRIIKPLAGTIITREWQGIEHRVRVLDSGFEYENVHYRSLTPIATKICGSKRSGPNFFGLNKLKED